MTRVRSFEPIIGRRPRILILGSMPGVASLQAVQYYAHPRNAFWPIMAALFGLDHRADYEARLDELCKLPLILWDTLEACQRPGSLDSSIDVRSARANNIADLLQRFPGIRAILFNGAAAEKYFRQLVLPTLPEPVEPALLKMPSTSPAHAGMSFDQKLETWRRLLDFLD